jgi:hypothetical protein
MILTRVLAEGFVEDVLSGDLEPPAVAALKEAALALHGS